MWQDNRSDIDNKEALEDRVKDFVRYYNSLGPNTQDKGPNQNVAVTHAETRTEISKPVEIPP